MHCTGSPDVSHCALFAIKLWDTELLHNLMPLEKPWQIWSILQMCLTAPTFEQAAKLVWNCHVQPLSFVSLVSREGLMCFDSSRSRH